MSKSTKLTAELEAEIRSRTHIRLDEEGTKPGDPGNGHILVIDETRQKFNGRTYHRKGKDGYYVAQKVIDGKTKTEPLHVAVWEFHNGSKPENHVVHHNRKDENGQWDKSSNDIESLLLVTRSEHRLLHSKYKPSFELECENCRQTFIAQSLDKKYCPKCEVKFFEDIMLDMGLEKVLAAQKDQSETLLAPLKSKKVIRYCFFCKRPFKTDIGSMELACNRPDCQGRKVAAAIQKANTDVLKRLTECGECFFKFSSAQFRKPVRCVFIDGEVWLVANDVCNTLGCKNPDDVLAKCVDEENIRLHELNASDGVQTVGIINKDGLDSLASKIKKARTFGDRLEETVLPAIDEYTRYFCHDESAPILGLPDGTSLEFIRVDGEPFTFSEKETTVQYFIPV